MTIVQNPYQVGIAFREPKHSSVDFICRDIESADDVLRGCLKVLGKDNGQSYEQLPALCYDEELSIYPLNTRHRVMSSTPDQFSPTVRVVISNTKKFNVIDVAESVCNACPKLIVKVKMFNVFME